MGSALFRVCSVWGLLCSGSALFGARSKARSRAQRPVCLKGIFLFIISIYYLLSWEAPGLPEGPQSRPPPGPQSADRASSHAGAAGGPVALPRAKAAGARRAPAPSVRMDPVMAHWFNRCALVQPLLHNGSVVPHRHRISAIWAHQRDASERQISTVWAHALLRSLAHVHRNARWTRREVHGLM